MPPDRIDLLRASWSQPRLIGDETEALFYQRLLELDPALEVLFVGEPRIRAQKLMTVLHSAVSAADRLETLLPALAALGRRHADYGVAPADYDTFREALL